MKYDIKSDFNGFRMGRDQVLSMEVNGDLWVLWVAEAADRLLGPLDDGVGGLEARVGEAMVQGGVHVGQVPLDQLGDGRHGAQAAVSGLPVPAGEEVRCPVGGGVLLSSRMQNPHLWELEILHPSP